MRTATSTTDSDDLIVRIGNIRRMFSPPFLAGRPLEHGTRRNERNLLGSSGRGKGECILGKRRRRVPIGECHRVSWPSWSLPINYDNPSRQRSGAGIDPYLPIHILASKCHVFANDSAHQALADVVTVPRALGYRVVRVGPNQVAQRQVYAFCSDGLEVCAMVGKAGTTA